MISLDLWDPLVQSCELEAGLQDSSVCILLPQGPVHWPGQGLPSWEAVAADGLGP